MSEVMPDFDLDGEHEVAWLVADLTRLMGAEFNRRLRLQNIHLSQAQWRILVRLLRPDGDGQTQTELADSMGMEKAPLGVVLDKMESADLIERRPDPKDGRLKRIFVTAKTEEVNPIIQATSEALMQDMFAGLSQVRRLQLAQNLHHIKQNLVKAKQDQP